MQSPILCITCGAARQPEAPEKQGRAGILSYLVGVFSINIVFDRNHARLGKVLWCNLHQVRNLGLKLRQRLRRGLSCDWARGAYTRMNMVTRPTWRTNVKLSGVRQFLDTSW